MEGIGVDELEGWANTFWASSSCLARVLGPNVSETGAWGS